MYMSLVSNYSSEFYVFSREKEATRNFYQGAVLHKAVGDGFLEGP